MKRVYKMRINQLKAGVILSYTTQLIHILTGLIYTPIMLRLLGQSEYGLYQLVQSVVSYLGLLSFGFSAGYMRFYSRYKAKDDTENIAKLNGMFMLIFLAISVICLLCGGVMTVRSDLIFGSGLTPSELSKSRVLMALMVFNMAVTFVNSVFTSNITAHEKFLFQRTIELLRAFFNPFLTLPLLILGYGSIGMVVISTVLTIAAFVMNVSYSLKRLKIKFVFKGLDPQLLKEMWVFTFFIFINMIVDQINWSIDKFLLGRMVGTTAVAVYGVAGQLNALYLSLSSAISAVFIPRINMIVASSDNNNELTDIFTRVGRIQFIVLGAVLLGYILFGREFINVWAGDGYEASYRIGILLMAPVTVPLIQNLGIEIQRAKNMHKARSVVYLFIAVSNIFVSIPCIRVWGASGAALGTAISLTAGNIIFMNFYYHKKIKLNILYFWKQIARLVPAIAISTAVGLVIRRFMPIQNILFLAAAILAYASVYILAMWFTGMNDRERDLIRKPVGAIGRKLCGR